MILDMEDSLRWPWRTLRKIRHVLSWVPFLWEDADSDYESLYSLIAEKIGRMRRHQKACKNHAGCQEVHDQMLRAEVHLHQLLLDEYCGEEWEDHREKWPSRKMVHRPDGSAMLPSMGGEEMRDFTLLFAEEERRRVADLKGFARIFVKHSREWWD